jgi:alkanesulfonate monooxygenase SsuD/methylene tetrahydromethanopterin reductase-like flavin-dependent oxidoreductase (luciferase family)
MIMEKKPFRFGIASTGAGSGAEWAAKAFRAEELGYSTLVVPDHFVEQISPIPALAARAAAQEADIVGLVLRVRSEGKGPDTSDLGVSLETKVDWIRSEAGERFDEIELNVLTWAFSITEEPQGVSETLSKRFGVPPDALLELPFILVDSLDEIQERLIEHRERFGISYFMIWDRDMEAFASIAKRFTGK